MLISAASISSHANAMLLSNSGPYYKGAQVPRWQSGEIHFFCDVCGVQETLQGMENRDELDYPLGEIPIPDGWAGGGDMHLCPECASHLWTSDALTRELEKEGKLVEPVLDANAASVLACDDEGVLRIPDGIRSIGYKAFTYRHDIRRVVLPDSLVCIGPFAFACSQLETFEAPAHLKSICSKAFLQCKKLTTVSLSDEIEIIGSETFASTAIERLHLPASVRWFARDALFNTRLRFDDEAVGLTIDPDNPSLFVDAAGALYAQTSAGVVLLKMLATDIETHAVHPDTRIIFDGAYSKCTKLQSVTLPDGLETIGAQAFADCRLLADIHLPSSLASIGSEALARTGLSRLEIPASLLGVGPFIVDMNNSEQAQTLSEITVHEDNERFFMDGSLLCLRLPQQGRSVLLSLHDQAPLELPQDTLALGPHCFARHPRPTEICMGLSLKSIHPYAFPMVQMATFTVCPDSDDEPMVARFPSRNALVLSCFSNQLDLATLFDLTDHEKLSILDLREQAAYALERFDQPLYLSEKCRDEFSTTLRKRAGSIVALFARTGDIESIKRMARHGFITADNVTGLVDCTLQFNNPVVTAFMLDLKQRLFGQTREDFSL